MMYPEELLCTSVDHSTNGNKHLAEFAIWNSLFANYP